MIIAGWVVTLIVMMAIPLALSMIKRDGFDSAVFLMSLSMVLIYAIYTDLIPSYIIILPLFIMAMMLFGFSGSGISE